MTQALIVVDIQNDFLPGGSLAVPEGDQIIPLVNRLMIRFPIVVATQDWHPHHHKSFAINHPGRKPGEQIDLNGLDQILWPVHCVCHTPGAAFAKALNQAAIHRVFTKGSNPEVDSYSGFFDNGRRGDTGLAAYLKERGVREVFVCGLATDYCVKFTAMDAFALGFDTYLITDASRGVELNPGDVARTLTELGQTGVRLLDAGAAENLVQWRAAN